MLRSPADSDIAHLAGLTGDAPGPVPDAILHEPRGLYRGRAAIVLRPRDTAETAAVIRYCSGRASGWFRAPAGPDWSADR